MSLSCGECEYLIGYGAPLYAVTAKDSKMFTAVCGDCLAKIPKGTRSPCTDIQEEGLTFTEATSTRNIIGPVDLGTYTWSRFRHGKPLFSITHETAFRTVPKLATMYLRQKKGGS